ncbi:MAG: TonB-dependent receptor, partial [Bacteroidetes bacterium]|nr:TonB-dependent receptor [Bacteroidota bacterium]
MTSFPDPSNTVRPQLLFSCWATCWRRCLTLPSWHRVIITPCLVPDSYQLREGTSIRFGIDNVFDTFYHEHLSVGNLPNEGRNVYLSVSYT